MHPVVHHDAPDPPTLEAAMGALQAATRQAGCSLYLGAGAGGWAWAGPERSTLVLGPSRAGKTSSLVIPNVLAAPGAVVSTSTKPDVLAATRAARGRVGSPLLFDPSATVPVPPGVTRVGWSPVNAARSFDGALVTAEAMVRAGPLRGASGTGPVDHWGERAGALLAPLLHAAALEGAPMTDVVRWVDRHDGVPALETLTARSGDDAVPTALLSGILATDQREQSGIWSSASGVLSAYRSSGARASLEGPFLDPDAFCTSSHTLYICATGQQQRHLAPLVVGLLAEIRDAAYRRAARGGARPPVVFALDEVANIAPLPDLPALVSEGAGQGLLTLACLQDLSQARARWGREAEAFLSLFGCTVVLPGLADVPTLEALSLLAGRHEVASRTVGRSRGRSGRSATASVGTVLRPRLPPDVVARGAPGRALALDARNRLGWLQLTPAHAVAPFAWLTAGRERTRDHPAGGRSR
jgi:type IV secretory pathway TraG/TraD family ATPase VirD4